MENKNSDPTDEYFGHPTKIALMKRSEALWTLLRVNPRYSYYGRAVALTDPKDDTVELLEALAKVQGVAPCYYFEKSKILDLFDKLTNKGFTTDRHEHFRGAEDAYEASKVILKSHELPNDLTIQKLGPDTKRSIIFSTAELCQSCDVMPLPGRVMRGQTRAGINLVAINLSGDVVGSASSFQLHHSSSPHCLDVFWGALATRPDRRGQKISLILGAQTIVEMWENFGARGFITGVRSDNNSSINLCNKLGVHDTDWVFAQCIYPDLLGTSAVTK
jgi:hypothetical protein